MLAAAAAAAVLNNMNTLAAISRQTTFDNPQADHPLSGGLNHLPLSSEEDQKKGMSPSLGHTPHEKKDKSVRPVASGMYHLGTLQLRVEGFLKFLFIRYLDKVLNKLDALPSFKEVRRSRSLEMTWHHVVHRCKRFEGLSSALKLVFSQDESLRVRLVWRITMLILLGLSFSSALLCYFLVANIIPAWTAVVAPSMIAALSSWVIPLLLAVGFSAIVKATMPEIDDRIWGVGSAVTVIGSVCMGLGFYHSPLIINAFHAAFGSSVIGIVVCVGVFSLFIQGAVAVMEYVLLKAQGFKPVSDRALAEAILEMQQKHQEMMSSAEVILAAKFSDRAGEAIQANAEFLKKGEVAQEYANYLESEGYVFS